MMRASAQPISHRHPGRSDAESRDPGAGTVGFRLVQEHAARQYLTTKSTKDTKFRVIPNGRERREARISSFVPSLVSLVLLVVKNGLRPRSPTVDGRPRVIRPNCITLNPC